MEGTSMVSQDFCRQLQGYGLTTARIFYRRPDHPWLLQTYVWQQYDVWPEFPVLQKLLRLSLGLFGPPPGSDFGGHGASHQSCARCLTLPRCAFAHPT